MKAGKEYELLIDQMYRSLEPNAIVTHDDHIYDERAKISRQIDVSIKYQFAGVNHLIIVQAKDYKIKADIKIVDQFQQVIEDVNANKGILICSKGFSTAAINKAKSYGIECLTVHSALKKNWETLLKIPVRRVLHKFALNSNFALNIEHKAGKAVTVIPDTFSYDRINIINMSEVVMNHVIKKMGWAYITKSKKIKLDLKNLGLYHSFDGEMLLVDEGNIELVYLSSQVLRFFITPTNYLYVKDHGQNTDKIHNLTITDEILKNILNGELSNDVECNVKPVISATTFRFNDGVYLSELVFTVPGIIEGNYYLKGNKLIPKTERNTNVLNLENFLKSKLD